jgi:hypothetical protein
MMAALSTRLKHHGAVVIDAPDFMHVEWAAVDNPFALGYRDENGRLTHFFFAELDGENGPFKLGPIAYETTGQLMELLRLLRELGDQIHAVRMDEPAQLQLQTLIDNPIRQRNRTLKSELESGNRALAWWQFRVIDLAACVGARHWSGDPVSFNLRMFDPVTQFLTDRTSGTWQGIGGDYTITVAATSRVTPGHQDGNSLLTCDVGAFSRLWFGVCPASSLELTDRFEAPTGLLGELDRALRLPPVIPGMFF